MKARLRLHVGTDAIRASVGPSEAPSWVESVPYETSDELRDAVIRVGESSRPHRGSKQVLVSIDGSLIQQRTLTDLPPVAPRALRALVARGTSRFFRQNGHPLVSGAIWSASETGSGRTATAAAIDGVLAQAIVDGVARSGLRVEDIIPDPGPSELSLLPESERARQQQSEWRQVGRMAVATGLLWLIVIAGLAMRLWFESRRVESELRQLAEPRTALIKARQAIEEATAMVSAVSESQAQRQKVAGWVWQLTRAMPDSAFIEELTMGANGAGIIKGRAASAAGVVTMVQAIPGIGTGTVQMTGTAGPDGTSGWQGFTLTLGPGRNR